MARAAAILESRRAEIVDWLVHESGSTRIKAELEWDRLERGNRFAQRMQAGMTHVNDSPVNDLPNCPFGGGKNSGLGRYDGQWSIDELTTVHGFRPARTGTLWLLT